MFHLHPDRERAGYADRHQSAESLLCGVFFALWLALLAGRRPGRQSELGGNNTNPDLHEFHVAAERAGLVLCSPRELLLRP